MDLFACVCPDITSTVDWAMSVTCSVTSYMYIYLSRCFSEWLTGCQNKTFFYNCLKAFKRLEYGDAHYLPSHLVHLQFVAGQNIAMHASSADQKSALIILTLLHLAFHL